MAGLPRPERAFSPGDRFRFLVGFPIILVVATRRLASLSGQPAFKLAALLLGIFLVFFAIEPLAARYFKRTIPVYLLLEAGLIQALGLLQPYEDIYAIMYINLGFQVAKYASPRAILAWGSALSISMIATFVLAFGWISGLGRSVDFIIACVVLVSVQVVYTQTDAARQESQVLLADLQAAHARLKAYAEQVEELAASRERERLARELHDSVGQLVFSISLHTQSARMMCSKDPARLPEQLEQLQELTGQALSQMRALIGQWRPAGEQSRHQEPAV